MTDNMREDVLAALRACRSWRDASDEAVERLASAARVETVTRGAALIAEGEPADDFGVVVNGKARVYHLHADGRPIIHDTVESGGTFGMVASLAGGRHPASIDAATPLTVAWLGRTALFDLLAAEPVVSRTVLSELARRVVNLTVVAQTLALDVPSRLARFLFQRALAAGEPTPEGLRVPLGMPKSELAASLGTVPETLSRAFRRLQDDDVLKVRGSEVIVLDVGALARLGSG